MAQKPFFIGWESEAAPPVRQFTKSRTLALIILACVVAAVTAALQQTPSNGTFDFTVKVGIFSVKGSGEVPSCGLY